MKKQIIAIFILVSTLLTSCGSTAVVTTDEVVKKQVTTQTVVKDYFSEDIKLVGKISPVIETPIAAQVPWTIKEIRAEVGKEVKQWQILATIDLGSSTYWTSFNNASTAYNNSLNSYGFTEESISRDLETSRIQLENAKSAKENTYLTTDRQLEISQTQLDNIQTTKNNTVNTTDENLKQAQIGIDLATKQLDLAKTNLANYEQNSDLQLKSLYTQEDSAYDDIKVAIDNAYISVDSTLTQVDLILWVTDANKNYNDAYETYLWAKNSDIKIKAEAQFAETKNLYNTYLKSKNYDNKTKIIDSLNKTIALSQKTSELCDSMISVLDNSIIWWSFTQATLDSLKINALGTWISTKQTSINSIKWALISAKNWTTKLADTINTTKSSIDTQKVSLNKTIDISETSLINAKQSYENLRAWNTTQLDTINWNKKLLESQLKNTIASIKQTRDSVDNALRIAQSNYDSTKAKLNSQRIAAKSQIDSAKWWKDLAGIQLNNTSIIAPFDWIITARNIEQWWMVAWWSQVFSIWDKSQLKAKLDVNSDNISYLSLGQEAIITRWETTLSWVITLISPAADPTSKMFKVEIKLLNSKNSINLWDYVDVAIKKTNSTEKKTLVPYSSLLSLWQWDYSVFVIKDGIAKTRQVKIWEQNSTQVEIKSWLKEWEKVVTAWTLTLQDWDKIEELLK